MSSSTRLRHVGLAAALLLPGACGYPRLRQIPGSDRATHSWRRPGVDAGRPTTGCGGRPVPATVTGATIGDRGGVCAQITSDTVPDPDTDRMQPPRKIP